jgi:hypothetical protein
MLYFEAVFDFLYYHFPLHGVEFAIAVCVGSVDEV